MNNYYIFISFLQRGCLSDALPRSPLVVADLKGSGEPIGLRSVSCNDIVSAERNPNSMHGFDTNCNNHMTISTPSISSHIPSEYKPGKILDRSSEMLSQNKRYDAENDEPIWNYLCEVSLINMPPIWNEVHPFSGLLTSQLQCINCNWKVGRNLYRYFLIFLFYSILFCIITFY